MGYEYLEDVATADIAFRAWGETLAELFRAASDATMNVMVEDLEAIAPDEERHLSLDNEDLELLLFNFLQEFIYYKDSEQLLLRAKQVEIVNQGGIYRLNAIAWGESLDVMRHEQRVDVKAVTLHRFQLKQTDKGWTAMVILDI